MVDFVILCLESAWGFSFNNSLVSDSPSFCRKLCWVGTSSAFAIPRVWWHIVLYLTTGMNRILCWNHVQRMLPNTYLYYHCLVSPSKRFVTSSADTYTRQWTKPSLIQANFSNFRRRVITGTNGSLLLSGPEGTYFCGIRSETEYFPSTNIFYQMHA